MQRVWQPIELADVLGLYKPGPAALHRVEKNISGMLVQGILTEKDIMSIRESILWCRMAVIGRDPAKKHTIDLGVLSCSLKRPCNVLI